MVTYGTLGCNQCGDIFFSNCVVQTWNKIPAELEMAKTVKVKNSSAKHRGDCGLTSKGEDEGSNEKLTTQTSVIA
jgi:hypothetical protein